MISFIFVFRIDTLKQRSNCDPFFELCAHSPTATYKLLPKWQLLDWALLRHHLDTVTQMQPAVLKAKADTGNEITVISIKVLQK